MQDHSAQQEYNVALQVSDGDFYHTCLMTNPLMAHLVLETFKKVLDNPYFAPIERQSLLLGFLQSQTLLEPLQEVIQSVQESPLRNDYTKIILEWTYINSESIKRANLSKFDGEGFVSIPLIRKVKTDMVQNRKEVIKKIIDVCNKQLEQENNNED